MNRRHFLMLGASVLLGPLMERKRQADEAEARLREEYGRVKYESREVEATVSVGSGGEVLVEIREPMNPFHFVGRGVTMPLDEAKQLAEWIQGLQP